MLPSKWWIWRSYNCLHFFKPFSSIYKFVHYLITLHFHLCLLAQMSIKPVINESKIYFESDQKLLTTWCLLVSHDFNIPIVVHIFKYSITNFKQRFANLYSIHTHYISHCDSSHKCQWNQNHSQVQKISWNCTTAF